MQFPVIHLNGSAASELIEDNLQALAALQAAHDLLAKAAPHARDYYVTSDGAYQTAHREHGERLGRLATVMAELNDICCSINDQQDARQAQYRRGR